MGFNNKFEYDGFRISDQISLIHVMPFVLRFVSMKYDI